MHSADIGVIAATLDPTVSSRCRALDDASAGIVAVYTLWCATNGHIGVSDIAQKLAISHTTAQQLLKTVQCLGYGLKSDTRPDCDTASVSETPSPLAVLPLLQTRSLGHTFYYHASATSTNTVLKQMVAQQVPAGTIVLAEEQSAGRGRMVRGWSSPPHRGLYFSLLLYPQVDASRVTSLPLVIGASLIEVFAKKISDVSVQFKWPNDVLIDGKKVSGILCELHLGADGARNLIVGIGINVNTTFSDLPAELRGTATSLRMAGGQIVARPQLLADLLLTLENNIGLWQDIGFTPFMKVLAQNDSLTGKTITIERTADTVTGVADGLNLDGSLRLLLPDGTVENIYSGDAHIKKQ